MSSYIPESYIFTRPPHLLANEVLTRIEQRNNIIFGQEAHDDLEKLIVQLQEQHERNRQFHDVRWNSLQEYQKSLPDPIRQDICEILANGYVGTRSAT